MQKTKIQRRVLVTALAALLAAALPAATPTKAAEHVTIATDFLPHGMTAGLQLAVQNGWFRDAGLDVEVRDGKGSNATIQQVAAGQLDIGFAQLAAMAAAVSNGLPVISVMGFVQAGDNGLMIPADSAWKTLKDLKGKRIAVPAGSATAGFLDAFLRAGGTSQSDFVITNVDASALVSTYVSGNADAALSTVAYFAPLVAKDRPSRSILFTDVGLQVPSYGLVVRKDELGTKADMIGKFVETQQKIWVYIFAGHQQEGVDAIMAQRAGLRLDPIVLAAQLKGYMALFDTAATKGKPTGWQAESDWQKTLEVMRSVGMVKPEIKPADIFTNQFIANGYVRAN